MAFQTPARESVSASAHTLEAVDRQLSALHRPSMSSPIVLQLSLTSAAARCSSKFPASMGVCAAMASCGNVRETDSSWPYGIIVEFKRKCANPGSPGSRAADLTADLTALRSQTFSVRAGGLRCAAAYAPLAKWHTQRGEAGRHCSRSQPARVLRAVRSLGCAAAAGAVATATDAAVH
jgi:hypothetical protein